MSLEKNTQYLKITEKVSFNIASKASFVYILSRQKLIKNAKNGFFAIFKRIGEKYQNWKIQMRHSDLLGDFQILM